MSVFRNFKMLYLAGAGTAAAVVGIVAFALWTRKPAEKKPEATVATAQANSPDQAESEYSGILDKTQEGYRKERASRLYRQGISQSVEQSSNRIFETRLNAPPNITIREVKPIEVCACHYPDFWGGHKFCGHCGKPGEVTK